MSHSTLDDAITRLDATIAGLDAAIGKSPRQPLLRNALLRKGESILGEEVTALVPAFSTTVLPEDLTSTSVLPAHHNAQVLFSEFVRVLVGERCEGGSSEDGVCGEIKQYEKLCQQQVSHISSAYRKIPLHHPSSARSKQVLMQLMCERDMWRLLHSLYQDRQCHSEENDPADDIIDYLKSDQVAIAEIYDRNRSIREAQIVIDWLEKGEMELLQKEPEKLEYFSDSHVAWENSLRTIKLSNRASLRGATTGGGNDRLITSMDPDAPLREERSLHDLDQEEDRVLVMRVLHCLRSGAIFDAQDLCASAGQHWLAAVLEGWKLHHDPNVRDPTKRNPVHGNPYRDVWKLMAWRASEDSRLSLHHRAIYGTLCGNLKAMLLVCQKWEDLLWAHTKVLVDQRVEEALRITSTGLCTRSMVPLPQSYPERHLSMKDVFNEVEKLCGLVEQNNPHYIICKHLILDDIDGLLQVADQWLQSGPTPHLLRCLTHLLLVLVRMCRIVEPKHLDTVHRVLHTCVKAAMERGDVEQVAWYTAMLPPSQQVQCYASFLLNITDPPQRRHALHLAHTVNLDVAAIAATTAAIIRLTPGGGGLSEGLVGETEQSDRIKIAGLDWLLYDEQLRTEALLQGLALIRTFLIQRKITAANITLDKLPGDTLTKVTGDGSSSLSSEVEAGVREFLCYQTFLSAHECFGDWFDHFHQQKPTAPSPLAVNSTFQERIAHEHSSAQHNTALERWKRTLDSLSKIAVERLYNVLLFPDGGWLVDSPSLPHETDSSVSPRRLQYLSPELAAREPDRKHQLDTLRSIYIPQVCSLLQNVLESTEQQQQCIQLVDVVASEQYLLYNVFSGSEMQRFLLKLLEPARHLLDQDKDALGYPLY